MVTPNRRRQAVVLLQDEFGVSQRCACVNGHFVLPIGGLTVGRFNAWFEHRAENDMGRTPSLALFREALREKHLSANTTWRKNDLVDLAYLCCAAVYCDHASGDRAGRVPRTV